MKGFLKYLLLFLLFAPTTDVFSQDDRKRDFIEIELNTAADYKTDTGYEYVIGIWPMPEFDNGSSYTAKITYGKALNKKLHIIGSASYTLIQKNYYFDCPYCNYFFDYASSQITTNEIESELGIRYNIVNYKGLSFSVQTAGHYGMNLGQNSQNGFGFMASPMIHINLNNNNALKLNYNYEQLFGLNNRIEHLVGVGYKRNF